MADRIQPQVVYQDGISHIEIGPSATTALGRQLSWYHPALKGHPDGYTYQTFAGLNYYLITEGDNRRFLHATTKEELAASKKYRWENVKGLELHLGYALKYHLRSSPVIVRFIKENHIPAVWTEPLRELKNAERRWLRVVNRILYELRMEGSH